MGKGDKLKIEPEVLNLLDHLEKADFSISIDRTLKNYTSNMKTVFSVKSTQKGSSLIFDRGKSKILTLNWRYSLSEKMTLRIYILMHECMHYCLEYVQNVITVGNSYTRHTTVGEFLKHYSFTASFLIVNF